MGWANRVTLLRALLMAGVWVILGIGAPELSTGSWSAAFVLFVVTALTDVVDGQIARRLGEVSVFGRIADPFVDKLLVLGTCLMLLPLPATTGLLPAWAVVLLLAREFLVTALRGAVEGHGVSFQAVPLGKAKMLLRCVAVGAVLLHGAGFPAARAEVPGLSALTGTGPSGSVAHALVLLAVLATVVSGVDYSRRAVGILRRG
jgi:CDP-diacylglycerol--glycerol-3-phosphate 3-phosphatidyltransferase